MAYNPINWDNNTPINVTALDIMDSGIDANDNRSVNNDGRLDTLEGQNLDSRISSNDTDISNLQNLDLQESTTGVPDSDSDELLKDIMRRREEDQQHMKSSQKEKENEKRL